MNISDRIQNLRKIKGISQEELAENVGVSRQAVSKWESEQSLPDIDKIIIMSEYFDVTTDYILKGIETDRQSDKKKLNANIFVIVATALNFIGLIVSCSVWYEKQVVLATVIGLIFMVIGCMIFAFGLNYATENLGKAKRFFWRINIWLLTFIPLSFVYNVLFTSTNAPYPIFGNILIMYPVFWLVYISICLCVVFAQVRMNRNN